MQTSLRIISATFIIFGAVGWIVQSNFSPVYIGLMVFGVIGALLSLVL
jgi:hypothetical protein